MARTRPGKFPSTLINSARIFTAATCTSGYVRRKARGFLYARPESQQLLKPLVVSWGYESETPSGSEFVDHHEWWGTRDHAAFLSVPAAIEFQEKNDWDHVRDACHTLAIDTQTRICELTGLPPLHSPTGNWFRQMFTAPLLQAWTLPSSRINCTMRIESRFQSLNGTGTN